MTTTTPALTAQLTELAKSQAAAIAVAPTSSVNSNEFVFFAAFDGTDNGANPPADGSGDNQTTAIKELYDQVFPSGRPTGTGNIGGAYIPGVGTPGTTFLSAAWDESVTAQSIINAQNAYNEFAQQAYAWHEGHSTGTITSMITSFSRGGSAAAIFAQMLYENGLVFQGHVLIPPGTVGAVSAALIIDPVLTGDQNVVGQTALANLDFPPGVKNLTIVQAQNEYRDDFPAATYTNDGATVLPVLGNHGDTGDLYDNGLGAIYLQAYTSFFSKTGLAIGPVPSDRAYVAGTPLYIHSENQTAAQILTSGAFWDATYNTNPITNLSAYIGVTRETASYGTPVAATPTGGTIFTTYDGDIVLGGVGASSTVGGSASTGVLQNFVIVPGSTPGSVQATITSTSDNINVSSDALLTFNSTALVKGTTSTVQGLPNVLTLADNAALILNGWNSNVTANNDTITLAAGDGDTTITGSGNTITLGANATPSIIGVNKIILAEGASVSVSQNGAGNPADTITYDITGGSSTASAVTTKNNTVSSDATGSDSITFDPGTYITASQYTNSGSHGFTLTTADGFILGTLDFDTNDNTDSLTLTDGLVLKLPGITDNVISAPAETPDQTLQSYLTDLDFAGDPDSLDYDYLNPTGTDYTVTGSISGKTDTFTVDGTPGAVATGKSGYTNILDASGDLSEDTISNMQTLAMGGDVALTGGEWSDFENVSGGGTLVFTTSGDYSLLGSGPTVDDNSYNLTAEDWGGTTLTGNDAPGETLSASLYGDDTLTAGNGAGDVLIAGQGVDTLNGGTGGDTFYVGVGLASGSSISGNGAGDVLQAVGDISGATVTDVPTLEMNGGDGPGVNFGIELSAANDNYGLLRTIPKVA